MHKAQEQVRDFHRACGLRVEEFDKPVLDWYDATGIRWSLIAEECRELHGSILNQDPIAYIDALCDILYVVYGAAVAHGIDLEPFFDEVHRSNMTKASGPKREDGKQLKPEGYIPPDIGRVVFERYGVQRLTENPRPGEVQHD